MLYLILGSIYFLIAIGVWVERATNGNYKFSRVHNERLWYLEMLFKSLLWLPLLIWRVFLNIVSYVVYHSINKHFH